MLDLKVLDAGLSDASVKVEDVRLGVIVPHRSFVVQLKDTLLNMKINLLILESISVFLHFIVKIDSRTWSFCLCQSVQNGISYPSEET
jgi:hypothetical protein